jgi:N-acetylglucosaminyl-diphospho-decaprenol L-rhamnosyltransferase
MTASPGGLVSGPDVSVVIVHYETPGHLARCLGALAAGTAELKAEVFVVDNASTAFDASAVAAAYPGARVIVNDANLGFARAANGALRQAAGRYLLLLNPDAFVEPGTLPTMVEYMDAHPDVGCSTARLVKEDGTLDLACRRSFPTPMRAFYRISLLSRLFPRSRRISQYNLTYLDEHAEADIDSPCGAFMMVRAEVRERVGLLDERYFMYGEDLDWAYRIKQAGWRVTYQPAATVHHIKRAASRQRPVRTVRAFHDAMRIFYRQHYAERYPRLLSWLVMRAIDAREALQLASLRLAALRPRRAGS